MSDSQQKRYVSKRVKVKTIPFELDESISKHQHRSGGAGARGSESKVLIYRRNEFLAVRNDKDGFFLCRPQQHVYESTKRFNIQWLEQESEDELIYSAAYLDMMDLDCVLTDVRMKRVDKDKYQLQANQKLKIENALTKSVLGGESSHDDDDDVDEIEEPPKKKAKLDGSARKSKVTTKSKAKTQKKGVLAKKGSLKKTTSAIAVARGIRKRALGRTGSKVKASEGQSKTNQSGTRKGSGRKKADGKGIVPKKGKKGVLVPRPSIKVLERDPLLYSEEKMPFVSTLSHSKLLLRAALTKDNKLLKELIQDWDRVAKLDIVHSESFHCSPLQIALELENLPAVELLSKEMFAEGVNRPKRVALTSSLLQHASTGRYNRRALHGVPFIRKLNLSRGSKEGNNAFTKDFDLNDEAVDIETCIKHAIMKGVSKKTLDKFCAISKQPQAKDHCFNNIFLAVERGHRRLAADLMADLEKTGLSNFNFLHHDVLAFDNEELRSGIREVSVKKKPFNNRRITPLHCAAINPNVKYLTKLLAILPDYNILDSARRRPIHYAVTCEDTGPLQLLLDRGVNYMEVDSSGMSPLFLAVQAGRQHNVKLLLSRAKQGVNSPLKKQSSKAAQEDVELDVVDKFGIAGVNMGVARPQAEYFSYTPLHLAAHEGYTAIADTLLQFGAEVGKELSASKNKLTPLMIAASCGHIDTIRLLIKSGAKVSQRDKIKRTAMMLAAMNGHAHIISFLLSLGCSPNDQDSSGNTALHYAAAYGWYFCVKVLLEGGANPNTSNDWKTTPMAIAFLKGHVGLADVLLEHESVDINFRLDGGMTLVHTACVSNVEDGIVEQLEYLVVKKKKVPTATLR